MHPVSAGQGTGQQAVIPASRPRDAFRAPAACGIAFLIFAVDQFTKWAVIRCFEPGQSVPLIPGLLHLTYVQNTGAAFGLLRGMTPFLIVLSLAVTAWILWELRGSGAAVGDARSDALSHVRLWGLSLVLGGAIGNLVDRIVRGYVVDFIDVRVWPVFNVADTAITVGVAFLLLPLVWKPRSRVPEP